MMWNHGMFISSDSCKIWSTSLAIATTYRICSCFIMQSQNLCTRPLCPSEWSWTIAEVAAARKRLGRCLLSRKAKQELEQLPFHQAHRQWHKTMQIRHCLVCVHESIGSTAISPPLFIWKCLSGNKDWAWRANISQDFEWGSRMWPSNCTNRKELRLAQ